MPNAPQQNLSTQYGEMLGRPTPNTQNNRKDIGVGKQNGFVDGMGTACAAS